MVLLLPKLLHEIKTFWDTRYFDKSTCHLPHHWTVGSKYAFRFAWICKLSAKNRSVNLDKTRRSKQCKSLIWIIILFSVLICYRICREEQLSRGTLLRGTLLWEILRDIDIWWYWVNIGRYWLVFGGTGSVWGSTGWYLVILGHFNLVLFGIKWYWVIKGLLCLYILKKLMVTSTNRPTNRQGEYRAICLFRKLENRNKDKLA